MLRLPTLSLCDYRDWQDFQARVQTAREARDEVPDADVVTLRAVYVQHRNRAVAVGVSAFEFRGLVEGQAADDHLIDVDGDTPWLVGDLSDLTPFDWAFSAARVADQIEALAAMPTSFQVTHGISDEGPDEAPEDCRCSHCGGAGYSSAASWLRRHPQGMCFSCEGTGRIRRAA